MATITDQEWEELKKIGKNLPPISESLDLKMTRKILQNPYAVEYFFDGYRKDLKEKLGYADEMEENISRLASNDDIKYAFRLMIFLHNRSLEMFKEYLDIIEALSFQNTELRKDLNRFLRLVKPTKNKSAELDSLIKKVSSKEKQNSKFVKDYEEKLPYVKRLKDFFDNEAGKTSKK